jgi:hypothetical protein
MDDRGSRIYQEFYCNDCNGYFGVKINIALNYSVVMVCPNCGRKHPRTIKDGKIFERTYEARGGGRHEEEIVPPPSAYHKKPWTKEMKQAAKEKRGPREGVEIEKKGDSSEESHWLRKLWTEFHGGNK